MRDKRPVDELSIEELERILAIRKREERQKRMQKFRRDGRVIGNDAPVEDDSPPARVESPPPEKPPVPQVSEVKKTAYVSHRPPVSRPAAAPRLIDVEDMEAAPRFEDEIVETPLPARPEAEDKRVWKRFMNLVLVAVEVAAVLGLVFLGYNLYLSIARLEEETATAAALADEQRRAGIPTIEPTPQMSLAAVVLPGGHTPPTAPGGAQFNYDEIPEHLLPLVQNEIAQPVVRRPAATSETALRLIIPKLNVDQTIVQGVDWEALRLGIGQLSNGADPNDESGNLVLAAHNDIYGEYFRYLDQLEPGDQFQVQTQSQIYTYTITGSDIVSPTAVHVMDHTSDATATLISCYPYQVNDRRIVIFARRDEA